MNHGVRALVGSLLLLAACDCGASSTAHDPAPASPAAVAEASGAATPATVAPAEDAEPHLVRVTMPSERGTLEYVADLDAGSITATLQRPDGTTEPVGGREGSSFPTAWRDTIARLARASIGVRCEVTEGVHVGVEIDGELADVIVPPFPEDRDYFPPDEEEVRACPPHELVRTLEVYVSWE